MKNLHNCCPKMWQAIIRFGRQCFPSQTHSFLEYDVVKTEWTQKPILFFSSAAALIPQTLKSCTAAVIIDALLWSFASSWIFNVIRSNRQREKPPHAWCKTVNAIFLNALFLFWGYKLLYVFFLPFYGLGCLSRGSGSDSAMLHYSKAFWAMAFPARRQHCYYDKTCTQKWLMTFI